MEKELRDMRKGKRKGEARDEVGGKGKGSWRGV